LVDCLGIVNFLVVLDAEISAYIQMKKNETACFVDIHMSLNVMEPGQRYVLTFNEIME